jgi:hypothetical protein
MGSAQRFALVALGRAWTLLGSRENSKPRVREMLAVNAARREAAVPSAQCITPALAGGARVILMLVQDALLGGGVVDASPRYALLANSRLNPIDFLCSRDQFHEASQHLTSHAKSSPSSCPSPTHPPTYPNT